MKKRKALGKQPRQISPASLPRYLCSCWALGSTTSLSTDAPGCFKWSSERIPRSISPTETNSVKRIKHFYANKTLKWFPPCIKLSSCQRQPFLIADYMSELHWQLNLHEEELWTGAECVWSDWLQLSGGYSGGLHWIVKQAAASPPCKNGPRPHGSTK